MKEISVWDVVDRKKYDELMGLASASVLYTLKTREKLSDGYFLKDMMEFVDEELWPEVAWYLAVGISYVYTGVEARNKEAKMVGIENLVKFLCDGNYVPYKKKREIEYENKDTLYESFKMSKDDLDRIGKNATKVLLESADRFFAYLRKQGVAGALVAYMMARKALRNLPAEVILMFPALKGHEKDTLEKYIYQYL